MKLGMSNKNVRYSMHDARLPRGEVLRGYSFLKTLIIACCVLSAVCCPRLANCFASEIKIQRTKQGGYQLFLNAKPFLIQGVGYNPTPVGKGYDYNFFSDKNKPWLVDGPLMKKAGINCLRIYSTGDDLEKVKEFTRDMYEKFGIYTAVSDWIGLWEWPRANYADNEFREKTKQRILKIVEALKDEEGLFMWILGNENNYTFSGKIGFWTSPEIEEIEEPIQKQIKKAEIYYSFINDLSVEIKKIDPVHPTALGNGDASFLSTAEKICKNIDILSIITYRGKKFGNLFNGVRKTFDKPIVLSEFGCDSYDAYNDKENQEIQGEFLLSQWEDLYENTLLSGNEKGNCLGGFTFEWSDEWWKHDEGYSAGWSIHNKEAGWSEGSYFFDIRAKGNLNMNEEWFGIVALQNDIDGGADKRIPKKSFYILKDFFSSLKLNSSGLNQKTTAP
ncbi:MAG: glycoside hydrolase family 2 TIM barrel-domain containing protein [Candidatus Omnitrophota bacterium]